MRKVLNTLLLFALSSCTMYPKYVRESEFAIPTEWRIHSSEMNELGNVNWWKQLKDPVLDQYIQEALLNNQDLKVAIATVDAFAAKLGVARSELYPQLSGTAGVEREKVSKNLTPLIPGTPDVSNAYDLIFNASYQLDVWGQIRSAVDAAQAELFSSIQTRRTVVLTLVSATASTYIQMRQFDKQLKIAQETKRTRDISYKLAHLRYELGLTSLMPVEQAKSEIEDAQTTIDQIAIQIALMEDLLSFLIGRPSETVPRGKLLDEIQMPPCVPAYLPSELINQRPDILAAEQKLIAANAQIGVARANFFPNISLTGQYGVESAALSNLFTKPSTLWEYGVSLLQQVFTGGNLINQLRLTEAAQKEALHAYQSAILNGFKEVNDSLISHRITVNLVNDQRIKIATLKNYLRLSWLRYQNGQTDYLNFLDAERQLFRAELEYAAIQGNNFTTLIDLYKALGGGWVVAADCEAQPN